MRTDNKKRTAVVQDLLDLASARDWQIPELRNWMAQEGFQVPLPSLRSWIYTGVTPSQRKQDEIRRLISVLASLDARPSKVLLRFKVTQKQIASAKRDKRFQAISVSGVRASKERGFLVQLFDSTNGPVLPLQDSCFWASHVADLYPKSCCLFESLYQLLTNSPGEWISCQCQLQPKNFLTD